MRHPRHQTSELPNTARLRPAAPVRSQRLELPAQRSSVRIARQRLAGCLDAWSVPPPVRDDAVLLISELATNVVVHTASPRILCAVSLSDEGTLRIEVHDSRPAQLGASASSSVRCSPAVDEENGRGLLIVQELADSWGVSPSPATNSKVVWATLTV